MPGYQSIAAELDADPAATIGLSLRPSLPDTIRGIEAMGMFRFSIRALLLLTLLCGIAAAWWSIQARRQARREFALALLQKSPSALTHPYDPVPLVRAVNYLHSMGKEEAITVLRRFAQENPNDGSPTCPHQSLDLIVNLLFDRANPEDMFPTAFAFDEPGTFRWTVERWPNWIIVSQDIPFHCGPGMGFSGSWADLSYLMIWAESHGRLRASPLRPADNPLAAADALVEKMTEDADWNEEDLPWLARHLRQQAFRAIAHLLPSDKRDDSAWHNFDDQGWGRLKEQCAGLVIMWDEARQDYVALGRE